ncbi:MAG: NHLP family bacteriocin export ABC transporter peptidase/permease/ATPase subunit [Coriobacteriales bacterium]|nr:NHLP family bacteriocin export ABC transporter peptidase/permease/ATPase subunit [Coriobacteriales bacterium]
MAQRVVKCPQIMQMEALECGAACLTMILAYYGRWVPLERIRTDCGVSRDGSKATNILKAARSYGLEAKGMTYSTQAIRDKGIFPCILFWNFNHFVVLRGFCGQYAYLNDPARGQVKVPMDEFDQSFTGVALVFNKGEGFKPGGTPPSTLKAAMARLEGMGPAIALVMLTAAIGALLGVFNTSLNKVFLDRVLAENNDSRLMFLIGIMTLLAIITTAANIINSVYLIRIQGKTAVVSSSRFMRHLLHLPVEFYSQRMVGDLQRRQSANETIAFHLVGELAPVLIDSIMLILYLGIMLRYSVVLTLVGIATMVLNALVGRYISAKRVNVSRSMVTDSGKLYGTTVGGVEMIETIKAAGAENGYFQRWAGYQANVADGSARMTVINEYLGAIPVALTQLANITVLLLGIWLIIEEGFTAGALLAFQGFLSSFMAPVSRFIGLGQTLQEMETEINRVDDVMRYRVDVPEEPLDSDADTTHDGVEKLRGQVDVNGVTFGYSPLDEPLIENFDLHIKPGQWVALVGGSGSGKSTIAKLVSGLIKPWSGEVRFDDVLMSDIRRPVMRGSLAVVDQDIVTFDGSISDNVKLWDKSIEDYEVIMAARDADIHDEVTKREGGYSSRIMPGGRNFSGGQLQRLEIARVLAQDPTIIILDEATSALDAQTEANVIKHIRDREITCIVVAHRLSTIRDCDEIVVLDHGKVVERGTHDELLAANGAYATLVRSD